MSACRTLCFCVATAALCILQPSLVWAENARPNILLIVADDLGYSDLGCYGGEIGTPNLDALAGQGMRFTQFYNNAVCVTTRASLYTGLYPRQGSGGLLRTNMVTLGEMMQAAGYRTAMTGKWHLGSQKPRRPIDRGFGEYYGLLSGCCNYFNPAQPDPVFYNGGNHRPFAHNDQRLTEFPADYFTTDAFSDHAVRTIRELAQGDAPFFLNVCYTAPHFPLHAKPEDIEKYLGKYKQGYFELRKQRHRRQVELGVVDPKWKLSELDQKLGDARYDYDTLAWQASQDETLEEQRMEVYAAMVHHLDRGVGQVLAALEEAGVADNTLVMFFSDNGGCATLPSDLKGMDAYNAGKMPGPGNTYDFCGPGWGWAQCAPFRRFKTWNYEGGISTPCIVRWPGVVEPNSITNQVGHLIDIMPTWLEIAGGEYPAEFQGNKILPLEGKSLLPVFKGEQRPGHDMLYWALYGNRAVRHGKWKLVWGVSGKEWELYDMEADRTETTNLAQAHPELVKKLSSAWNDFAQKTEVHD